MKKHLLAVMSILVCIAASAQPTATKTPSVKTDYLKKSKSQKTAAWILLGSGVALVSTGFVIGMTEAVGDLTCILLLCEEQQSSNTGEIFFYTGLASMGGSIPLFIASSKNKRKAEQVAVLLKMEKSTCFQYQLFKQISYLALSVKISL